MPSRRLAALALGILLAAAGDAAAARVRYLFVPDRNGGQTLVPQGTAERLGALGWSPTDAPLPRATQVVSFRHPCTGQGVNVPLALPPDQVPRMEYTPDRVVYNYGSDTVEVRFLADGMAFVIYNTGLFRDPWR